MHNQLTQLLQLRQGTFSPVVPFDAGADSLKAFDLGQGNAALTPSVFNHLPSFARYFDQLRGAARYGIGGYGELRGVYALSALFNRQLAQHNSEGIEALKQVEPRRLHLGTDIWGEAGTPVHAPLGGIIHSFAFNNNHGDYGATIILSHQLENCSFFTLYGHLSLADLKNCYEGDYVVAGQKFAHFGPPAENGNWPPHLHFQIIEHIGLYRGDYPGVCKASEKDMYLANCPDPDLILDMNRHLPAKG